MEYYGFDRFQGFRVEGKVGKVVDLKMRSDCSKICQGFCDYSGSFSDVTELKSSFDHTFDVFLQLNEVSCGYYHYWRQLPVLLGTVSCYVLASVSNDSVAINSSWW